MYEIREIHDSEEKSTICNCILRKLPNWFGMETGIVEYVNGVREMPFFASFDGENAIGFVSIKTHNTYTSEIYVMGIIKEYHRQGIGKKLISCCEEYCKNNEIEFLTVKTLDESRESKSYEKTRLFYLGVGFKPLEVFTTLWDEDNPCLFLAKYLGERRV